MSNHPFDIWDFYGFAVAMADRYRLIAAHPSAAYDRHAVNYRSKADDWARAAERIAAKDGHGLYGLASLGDFTEAEKRVLVAAATHDQDDGTWSKNGVAIGGFVIPARTEGP